MLAVEEEHAKATWAEDLSDDEIQELRKRRYLLQRPGNSTINWTAVLAARTDMTQIDGLQNLELHQTQGIASLGIFAGKNGKARDDENAQEDPLFYMSDVERAELDAQQAEKHAKDLRERAENAKKLRELDQAKENLKSRPQPPDYGGLSNKQLVEWAKENLDAEIKLPMNKAQIIQQIEALIHG